MRDENVTLVDLQKKVTKNNNQPQDVQAIAHALVSESSRLMEMFIWHDGTKEQGRMQKRFARCMQQVLLFAHEKNINLEMAFKRKLLLLEKKYPIDQVKGKATVK